MIPKNWINKELGDVAFSTKGKKPKYLVKDNSSEFSIPYVNIKAFEGRGINEYTNGEKCVLCKSTDILIVWDGARFGLVGKGVAGAIGSTLAHIQSKIIVDTLLFYFLQYHYRYIQSRPKGVGIPHVDPNILWKIKILIPPLNEQHRIVEKIEELFTKLDASVTELKNVKKQLKRYRQSVLKAAFEGKLTEDNQKWQTEYLNDICDKIQDGSHYSPQKLYDIQEDGMYKYITSKNIRNNYMILENVKYVDFEYHQTIYPRCNPEYGDVLLTKDGANTGNVTLNILTEEFSLLSSVCLIKTDKEKLNPSFLKYFIQSPIGKRAILGDMNGTAIKRIILKKIKGTKISIPNVTEQQEIVEEIETRLSVADKIEEEIDRNLKKTEQLRQSILKKAFEGKLVPQDPNDEPAEKLLERIKKEKSK